MVMLEQDLSFPADLGVDYCLLWINTEKYPSFLSIPDQDSGEIVYELIDNTKSFPHKLPILVASNGISVIPANLYLHSLLLDVNVSSVKTLESHALALLSFYRFLALELPEHTDPRTNTLIPEKRRLTIYDCTSKIEESTIVQFRDYLLEHVYTTDENGKISGSPATAANYVLKIIAYYIWLHGQRIIECSKNFKPFEFSTKKILISHKNQRGQHDILSHLNQSQSNIITVYTTGLTKPFKNIQKPVGVMVRKLHPLREDEKQAFYNCLDVENSSDTKALMLYLKTEAGLRLEELVTFPISVIEIPKAEVVRVQIGERINGCLTKNRKNRTIEIPAHCMELLYEYKLSKNRTKAMEKGLLRHNHLFVQSNGNIYESNTIQKYVATIRNELKSKGFDIYFASHDLRATWATDWLYNKHIETGKPFDALIGELAELMGHESTATTQKYINYMNDEKMWTEFAQRKNNFAQQVLR